MSNNSIIEHRGSYHFVALREEYIAISIQCSYKKPMKDGAKSKASPHCKALILDILENWINTKRGKGEDLAIYMTYPQWIKAMYGMFGRNVIIDSLDELVGEGLILREPHKMYGKDTYKYRLNYKELNRRIKLLPEREPDEEYPQLDAFTNKPDKANEPFTNKRDAFTNKPVTRLQVNDDPFTKGRNIESDIDSKNIDTTESKKEPTVKSTEDSFSHSSLPKSSIKNSSFSSETKQEEKIILTEEIKQVYDLACEQLFQASPPEVTVAIKGHCAKLAKHVKNKEQMMSLIDFTRKEQHLEGKTVYFGNLARGLNGWLQTQQIAAPQAQSKKRQPEEATMTDEELAEGVMKYSRIYDDEDNFESNLRQVNSLKRQVEINNDQIYDKMVNACRNANPERCDMDGFLSKLTWLCY